MFYTELDEVFCCDISNVLLIYLYLFMCNYRKYKITYILKMNKCKQKLQK